MVLVIAEVKINNKFVIPNHDLPIHYTTFMRLGWQLRVVYSGIPTVKRWSKKIKSSFGQNFDGFCDNIEI